MRLKRYIVVTIAIIVAALLINWRRSRLISIDFESASIDLPLEDGSALVELDGLRVRTLVRGSGQPTIMLLHGFAASVFTWHTIIDQLANHGTVIAFDRPGYGFTSRPTQRRWTERNPYSLETNVDLTIAILDHFDIDRAILVGHSAGGMVAALTALEHPDRLRSLVLVAPATYSDLPLPEWLHWLVDPAAMQRGAPLVARVLARLTEPIMRRAWHNPSLITPDIVEGYLAPFRRTGWAVGMWEVVRANRRTRLGSRIEDLKIPTLVITGDHDRIVPVEQTKRLAHELANTSLKIIPDCGHIPQEERPDQFLKIVTHFIDSHPG